MTEREKLKKPIKDRDKNKDWEKDRRLRFNKAFDVLASLLPQYDPSKPFSKIETLQRSILLIEELQKEKKELLAGSNKEILKNQEELETTINMLRSRNEQLMEILRKAEIPIPEFNTKNTWIRNYKLDNKIEEKFTKIKENNLNEINLKKRGNTEKKVEFEKLKKYSKKLNENDMSKILETPDKKKSKKTKKKTLENSISTIITDVSPITTTQPPLMCLQIISNSIIVSNSSTSSEATRSSTVTPSTCTSSSCTTFSTTATPIMATGIFVPIMKLEPVTILKNKKIKPKPMDIRGKLPIPPLPRKPKIEVEQSKNSEAIKCDAKPTPAKKAKKNDKITDKVTLSETSSTNKPDCSKELTITTPELTSDILENLQVPPSNQHPESLSPTAAYLMNFPLVSTKAAEDDVKNESESANLSKKVEEKELVNISSNNQNSEMLLDDNFPALFNLNPHPAINAQLINTNEMLEHKMDKNQEPLIKLSPLNQQDPEKSLVKYSASAFTIDFVSKSQPVKPTFTFSLTSTVSSASIASTTLPSSLPITSLTTPTFTSKSNFDFLPKPSYPITTVSSCLNETFPSCAAKQLGIVNKTATPSFSFSLTTLTTTANPTIYSSSTTKSANFPNFSFPPPTPQVAMAASNFNNNPFSIEQQITTTIGTNFTFSLTNSVPSNHQMKYTSCPSYNTFNPFSTNTIQDSNVNNFVNNTSYGSGHSSTLSYDNGFNRHSAKKHSTQKSTSKYSHQPVNWMMTSSVTSSTASQYKAQNSDYSTILPPPPPPPLETYYPDLKRNSDIFFAHPPGDDNFPWSPNKMSNILDGSHYPNTSHSFMPSTLPNLHGDLALSTTSAEPVNNNNNGNQIKVQNNFFSVSQLVDNQPSNITHPAMKLSNKPLPSVIKPNNAVQSIVKPAIRKQENNNFNIKQTSWNYSTESMLCDNNNLMPPPSIPPPPLPLASAASSSITSTQKQSSCNIYSAESLIASSTNHNQSGNILQKKETSKYNRSFNDNYNPIIPPPSTDSYFSMDYLNSNVGNTADNTTTNYNNFLYNSNNNNNYTSDNNYYPNAMENYNNVNIKNSSPVVNTSSYKQYPAIKPPPPRNIYHNNINQANTKHTSSNMNRNLTNSCSLPNYDTLPNSTYFQPAMGINSPLVEDPSFHLYHASSSSYHHHQLPSTNLNNNNGNTGNGGGSTSLANFNLSTICPEINDKVRWG